MAESYAGVESTCAVARRYGLAQTQIFTWRRELRRPAAELGEQMFVPVIMEPASKESAPKPKSVRRRHERGGIEVEIGGVNGAGGAGRRPAHARDGAAGLEGGAVIPGVTGPPAGVKVLMATKPVHFRKGMDGLARLVKEEMKGDPFSGVVYVFRSKRSDRLKIPWGGVAIRS